VTTKNNDDRVALRHENRVVLVDVQSPAGIGSAIFELESGVMPGEIIIRLHLQGLEQFRLTSAQDSLSASVSSREEPDITEVIVSAGSETPILPGHPLWMEIEIISESTEQSILLAERYFEITLPTDFLQKAGTSFEIQWIDFYR
jgi:hypothetical protein